MKQSVFILSILSGLFCLRCDLINPEESIPAFLQIEAFTLETDDASQGSASHKITEGWLTVNDEFLGVYQLPVTVPILLEGNARIYLEAGIKDNGIGSTPQIYPFYDPFETGVELLPGQTVQITPRTSYESGTRFAFIENFESGMTLFQDVLFGDGQVEVSGDDPFEGSLSGKIYLSMDDPHLEVATIQAFPDLTGQSPQVYLEVDYRSEVPVVFGLLGGRGTTGENAVFDPGFNPKESWNKIYFNLSSLLATSPFDDHQVILRAYIPTENGQLTLNNATVCLDNIKLVHF